MHSLQGEDLALERASKEACRLVLAALELLIPVWGTQSHLEDPGVPLRSRSLALGALLADVSLGHLELYDAECVAAGLLVQAVSEGFLSLKDVGLRLGHNVTHLVNDTLQVTHQALQYYSEHLAQAQQPRKLCFKPAKCQNVLFVDLARQCC